KATVRGMEKATVKAMAKAMVRAVKAEAHLVIPVTVAATGKIRQGAAVTGPGTIVPPAHSR
ncbi:MAG: hypothetical protein ABJ176_04660, partial [Anderseniella sp.]